MTDRVDVAVIGGGLAGAATALRLGRAGARVVLFERAEAAGPKVCGEFLSPAALAELDALAQPAARLGALPVDTLRIAAGRRLAERRLPFTAASLSRERLDAALLAAAAEVADTRTAYVRRLDPQDGLWRVGEGAHAVDADRVVVATGKHDLPGRRRPEGLHRGLVGLKTTLRANAETRTEVGQAVEIHLFPGGYGGMEPIEDGQLNVCLAVEARAVRRLGGAGGVFAALARSSARAGAVMAGADHARPLAIGHIPYGFVRRQTDGLYHVGDQAAVVASVCGEGMALALRSARACADAILVGQAPQAFQREHAARIGGRVRASAILSRLLVTPSLQQPCVAAAQTLPPLVALLASATRTPVLDVAR